MKRFLANCDAFDESDLEEVIPGKSKLIYVAYTVMMEQNLSEDDLLSAHCDGESVVLKLSRKALAKQIKSSYHKNSIRLGAYYYTIKIKVSDQYVFISAEQGARFDDTDD